MGYSFYEIYTTSQRAFRGMGFPFGADEDAAYIGIDRNEDDYHDLILYDVDDDESYSYWEIDLDMDGDFEWSGNRHNDKMIRYYRKFVNRIDSMLIDSFKELERLGMIE